MLILSAPLALCRFGSVRTSACLHKLLYDTFRCSTGEFAFPLPGCASSWTFHSGTWFKQGSWETPLRSHSQLVPTFQSSRLIAAARSESKLKPCLWSAVFCPVWDETRPCLQVLVYPVNVSQSILLFMCVPAYPVMLVSQSTRLCLYVTQSTLLCLCVCPNLPRYVCICPCLPCYVCVPVYPAIFVYDPVYPASRYRQPKLWWNVIRMQFAAVNRT